MKNRQKKDKKTSKGKEAGFDHSTALCQDIKQKGDGHNHGPNFDQEEEIVPEKDKRKKLAINKDPLQKFDFSAVDGAMTAFKNTMRSYDKIQTAFKRDINLAHHDFFKKIYVNKKPEGDLIALNKIDIDVEMVDPRKKLRSFSVGSLPGQSDSHETQSDQDFLSYLQGKFNEQDAYKITKRGFQYSNQEKLEALAFKSRLKKTGKLEKKNVFGKNKIVHGSIQMKQDCNELIHQYILSVDLLSNIKYNRELEQYQPRGEFNYQEDRSSQREDQQLVLENQADESVQSAIQNFMVKGFKKKSNQNSNSGSNINSIQHSDQTSIVLRKPIGRNKHQSQVSIHEPSKKSTFNTSQTGSKMIAKKLSGAIMQRLENKNGSVPNLGGSALNIVDTQQQPTRPLSRRQHQSQVIRKGTDQRLRVQGSGHATGRSGKSITLVSGRSNRKSNLGTKASERQLTESKFKDSVKQDDKKAGARGLNHQNIPKSPEDEIKRFTDKEWVEILLNTDLNEIQYKTFKKLMRNPYVLNKVSLFLLKLHGCDSPETLRPDQSYFTRNEIDYALNQTDKDLFVKFRDKKLTFDQLRARTAHKNGYATYKVLDDIRDKLDPELLKKKKELEYFYELIYQDSNKGTHHFFEKLGKGLARWERQSHCVRTITHKKAKNIFENGPDSELQQEIAKLKKLRNEDRLAKRLEKKEVKEIQDSIINKIENFLIKTSTFGKQDDKFKKKAGESAREYEDRIREIRINMHFKKFMRRHHQLVKEETAFHNTVYDDELLKTPDWKSQVAVNKAKDKYTFENKGQVLKSQKIDPQSSSEKEACLDYDFEKKPKKSAFQKNAEQTRRDIKQIMITQKIAYKKNSLDHTRKAALAQQGINVDTEESSQSPEPKKKSQRSFQDEQEDGEDLANFGSLSERLDVPFTNFGKDYEIRNSQRAQNALVLAKNQKGLDLFRFQEDQLNDLIQEIKSDLLAKYKKVVETNAENAKEKAQNLINIESDYGDEWEDEDGRINGPKTEIEIHPWFLDFFARYKKQQPLKVQQVDLKQQDPLQTRPLAHQKKISQEQIKKNERVRFQRQAEALKPSLKEKPLEILKKQEKSHQPPKDHEAQRRENIRAQNKRDRDLMFMKSMKDNGNDIVISKAHRKLLHVEDRLLKAINEDFTSPRSMIRQITAVQARRDAVHNNKAHEGDDAVSKPKDIREELGLNSKNKGDEGEKKGAMPAILLDEIDPEYIDPNMKKFDRKAQQMDTVTQIMRIESQLKFDEFTNKMKASHKDKDCNQQNSKQISALKSLQKKKQKRFGINKQKRQNDAKKMEQQQDQANKSLMTQKFRMIYQKRKEQEIKIDTQESRNIGKIMANVQYQEDQPGLKSKGPSQLRNQKAQIYNSTSMLSRPLSISNQGIGTQFSPKSSMALSNNSRANTKRRNSVGVADLLSMQLSGSVRDNEMHAKVALVKNQMNISDIIPNSGSVKNYKERSITQTEKAAIKIMKKSHKKSGILSPNSGVSSFGGYQVTDPKLPDDLSETELDLNKIIAETMPQNFGRSRYPRQKMYETEQSFKRQIWKQAKNILEKEESDIKEQQQDFMASQALLKSQELRMKFCQHRNSKMNESNQEAINEQIKLQGYLHIGGSTNNFTKFLEGRGQEPQRPQSTKRPPRHSRANSLVSKSRFQRSTHGSRAVLIDKQNQNLAPDSVLSNIKRRSQATSSMNLMFSDMDINNQQTNVFTSQQMDQRGAKSKSTLLRAAMTQAASFSKALQSPVSLKRFQEEASKAGFIHQQFANETTENILQKRLSQNKQAVNKKNIRPHSSKENFVYHKVESNIDDQGLLSKEKSQHIHNIDDIVNLQSPNISSMRSSYNDSPNSNFVALKSKRRQIAGIDNEGRNLSGIDQAMPNRSRLSHLVKGTSREFMHNAKSGSFCLAGENYQLQQFIADLGKNRPKSPTVASPSDSFFKNVKNRVKIQVGNLQQQ